MKIIKSVFANAKFNIRFSMHLHIFIIREIKKVNIITEERKMSILLNRCLNN